MSDFIACRVCLVPGKRPASGALAPTAEARQEAFVASLKSLNVQFADFVRAQIAKDPLAPLIDAGNDYIQYVSGLEDKYLRAYGEVFTFGSGECGQLAHGVEDESALSVLRPRIVTSLRDKQVRLVACGGIHSVAVGDDGRVWSWGCNDDGALGRHTVAVEGGGNTENFPELVSGGGLEREQIVAVSCGDSQTIALTVGGDVYGASRALLTCHDCCCCTDMPCQP